MKAIRLLAITLCLTICLSVYADEYSVVDIIENADDLQPERAGTLGDQINAYGFIRTLHADPSSHFFLGYLSYDTTSPRTSLNTVILVMEQEVYSQLIDDLNGDSINLQVRPMPANAHPSYVAIFVLGKDEATQDDGISIDTTGLLTVTVQESDRWIHWDMRSTEEVKIFFLDVMSHFQQYLRTEYKLDCRITVVDTGHGGGYALFNALTPETFEIGLGAAPETVGYWESHAAGQVAHEICHVMHFYGNIEQTPQINPGSEDYPNIWFQEALAELANLWARRRMAAEWVDNPPIPRWSSRAESMQKYADWLLSRDAVQYPWTSERWLEEHEEDLRRSGKNIPYTDLCQLSYRFLPIFDETPEAWNAVRQLPISNSKMDSFMAEWYDTVDPEDKAVVAAIASEMGIEVSSSQTLYADVNNDGVVDLADVKLVRYAMTHESQYDTDLNDDGITDEVDLMIVKAKALEAIAAAAPRKQKTNITTWGALKRY